MENGDSLHHLVRQCCEQFEGIDAAYVFGSRAGTTYDADSDIDVALLLNPENRVFDLLSFIISLEKVVELSVDAVVLNRAGEELKFQVRSHGVLVYEKSRAVTKQFEILSRKYYEDYLYLHKRYVKNILYGELNG